MAAATIDGMLDGEKWRLAANTPWQAGPFGNRMANQEKVDLTSFCVADQPSILRARGKLRRP